jgi:hypothetical protein
MSNNHLNRLCRVPPAGAFACQRLEGSDRCNGRGSSADRCDEKSMGGEAGRTWYPGVFSRLEPQKEVTLLLPPVGAGASLYS